MDHNNILEKVNRQSGMTVPEGYFESFAGKMAASLPPQEWESAQPKVMPRSWWQRVRPYVYMAAMFAGVWCMMKMLDVMRPATGITLDDNPMLMSAVANDQYFDDFMIKNYDQTDVMDDLYEQGFDPSSILDEDTLSSTSDQ